MVNVLPEQYFSFQVFGRGSFFFDFVVIIEILVLFLHHMLRNSLKFDICHSNFIVFFTEIGVLVQDHLGCINWINNFLCSAGGLQMSIFKHGIWLVHNHVLPLRPEKLGGSTVGE